MSTSSTLSISQAEARKIALFAQGLLKKYPFGKNRTAILNAIQKLSYIQIDTISVIERAHHHTLFTRYPQYHSNILHELQVEKKVFEYWSHAAAYLPIEHYRFSLPRKIAIKEGEKHWHERDPKLMQRVLDRIRAEGPLQSKDFQAPPSWKQQGMWHWKPAKRALEQLFIEGELLIIKRNNFQKVYDITERALPTDINTTIPTDKEMAKHLINTTLQAHGVATAKQMGYLRRGKDKKYLKEILADLIKKGEVLKVQIEQIAEPYYVLANILEEMPTRVNKKTVKLLSPFDNAAIQRERLKSLFNFDYQIECYVPRVKRVYGYFCLPILWGDQFVGRLDPKADRKTGRFLIQKLWIEPNLKNFDQFIEAFARAIVEFATFHKCSEIVVLEAENKQIQQQLEKALKNER